jgi:L-lysine exporter family protein LysE/ArgO
MSSFLTGFFLGFSLILAIGAQNTFVLRQGILGQHVFYVALFCALSDALLILIGVASITLIFNNYLLQISSVLYGISGIWLTGYGLTKLMTLFKSGKTIQIRLNKSKKLLPTILMLAVFTFANPHVYLDTMILIGSISQQFIGIEKIAFTFGAITASFVFFFTLAYGAKSLSPLMENMLAWRILDFFIALIMFTIAIKLFHIGNWL